MRKRRGYLMFDALAALAIVSALATMLAVAGNTQGKAMNRMADQRQALRIAEGALTDLQLGRPLPRAGAGAGDAKVEIQPIEDGVGPIGYEWVQVRVQVGRTQGSLIGLARQGWQRRGQ